MALYSWLSMVNGVAQLQARLNSTSFWTAAECEAYITQALREWSSLTEIWSQDFAFSANQFNTWYDSSILPNSPRLRTVTDAEIYTQMQYMLLEPPTGAGTWTGTKQFALSDLQQALQHRRDEVIQSSGCNLALIPPASATPGTVRTILPDSVLEIHRIRFVPATSFGFPITLTREDTQAFQFFEPGYLGSQPSTSGPNSWSVASESPLTFDVDQAPNVPGTYDVMALNAGIPFAPPASTLLGVPDDWAYLPMWGALADLLGSESERTDNVRAMYCLKRFTDGIEIMRQSNWLVKANINGFPVDTPSLHEHDLYATEWQDDPGAWPVMVNAGIDLFGISPMANCGVGLTLIGSAPVVDGGLLQVSRDDWNYVLGYAERLATWKQGGSNFVASQPLEMDFYRAAMDNNRRLSNMAIFSDILDSQGKRELENVPR